MVHVHLFGWLRLVASVQVSDCMFTANNATTGPGGAIYVRAQSSPGSSLDIVGSSFVSNTAASINNGGAVSVLRSTFSTTTIHNTTFQGNEAGRGGGFDMIDSTGTFKVSVSSIQCLIM